MSFKKKFFVVKLSDKILLIFFVFSMSTLWFFYSLVKGRYTYDAFEYRWWIILDLDIKGFKEKRVTTSSPPEIPTQTPT